MTSQKLIPATLVTLGLIFVTAFAQSSAQTLLEKSFTATVESEALLDLTASSPGASWRQSGNEAAAVTIFVDGKYQQDLILFAGERDFTYQLMLGRVTSGEHKLRVDLNPKQSAANTKSVKIQSANVTLLDRQNQRFQAIANAPILYARRNTIGKFSDVPLLAYYDLIPAQDGDHYRYTVIFSNEDGGTNTTALMARWGRTTDIEWVCETTISRSGERSIMFQGVNHADKRFAGKIESDHPFFLTASDNNNFSDQGESEMRFAPAPIPFNERTASREQAMDSHPWTYSVMADEMIREGKITSERKPGQQIEDLRNYLYLDVSSDQSGGLFSLAVKLKGDPHWYTSDWGITSYKIERSGHFQTTVLLPRPIKIGEIERIAARCDVKENPRTPEEMHRVAEAACNLQALNKVFLLGDDYQPGMHLDLHIAPVKIRFGEAIEVYGGGVKK